MVLALSAPVVPIFASWRDRKLPSWGAGAGALCAAAGLGLLTLEGTFMPGKGDLLALACAVFFALQILAVEDALKEMSGKDLTIMQMGVVSLLSFGCWGVFGGSVHWSTAVIVALLVTAILATSAAFLVQCWAQRFTSPARVALSFSMEPVFAAIYSYFFGSELFTTQKLLGCVLVFTGIILGIVLTVNGKGNQEQLKET
jgi:drug/metabolite transporter (DMT)-like permease